MRIDKPGIHDHSGCRFAWFREKLADALNEKIEQKFDELLNSITGKVKTAVEQNGAPGKKSESVH
ncbi:MAG TPA: hypothetical protein VGD65_07800 [Chryseosolibacter sp.]